MDPSENQRPYTAWILGLGYSVLSNFPTIKPGKSRYHLYWVESTINQELIKNKKRLVNEALKS